MLDEKLNTLNPKSIISLKRYVKVIEYFKNKEPEGYSEIHHIIPKSMGGSDDPENLINVSARVHFILHWLLWKIFKNRKMSYAFHIMVFADRNGKRYKKLNSKTYSSLLENCRLLNSGENHPLYGRKKSQESIEKQRAKMLGTFWSDERKLKKSEEMKKDYSENPRPCIPITDDIRRLISQSGKGRSKPFSEEHKQNLHVHKLNTLQLTCPYCEKTGQKPNMLRWHFDNCKISPKD